MPDAVAIDRAVQEVTRRFVERRERAEIVDVIGTAVDVFGGAEGRAQDPSTASGNCSTPTCDGRGSWPERMARCPPIVPSHARREPRTERIGGVGEGRKGWCFRAWRSVVSRARAGGRTFKTSWGSLEPR